MSLPELDTLEFTTEAYRDLDALESASPDIHAEVVRFLVALDADRPVPDIYPRRRVTLAGGVDASMYRAGGGVVVVTAGRMYGTALIVRVLQRP